MKEEKKDTGKARVKGLARAGALLSKKNALAIVLIVVVFAAAFFSSQFFFKAQPRVFNNVTADESFSFGKLGVILSPKNVSVQLNVQSVDEKVFGLAVGSPEVVSAIAGFGKNVSVQGKISGEYCINSNQTIIECRRPQVILELGSCDCMKVVGETWVIRGSNEFFVANGANLRGIIRKAIGGQ